MLAEEERLLRFRCEATAAAATAATLLLGDRAPTSSFRAILMSSIEAELTKGSICKKESRMMPLNWLKKLLLLFFRLL